MADRERFALLLQSRRIRPAPITHLIVFAEGIQMDDLDQVTRVLIAYAEHGFDKVTMTDIAEAAGVSRQTLYNRHKTKEAILAWAAEGFSRHARLKACAELNATAKPTAASLVAAFSERMGILVPLVHGLPYGPQILDQGVKLRLQSQAQFPPFHADFMKELKLFLQARGVCQTLAEAEDISFLLMMSGKGLLMDTRSREEFETGMARIVAAVLREPPTSDRPAGHAPEDTTEAYPSGAESFPQPKRKTRKQEQQR